MPYCARWQVAVGAAEQFADKVLDIAADVAGFGEFGGVALDKGHADEVGGVADEVGFADAGRAEEDDVLLGVIGLCPCPRGPGGRDDNGRTGRR